MSQKTPISAIAWRATASARCHRPAHAGRSARHLRRVVQSAHALDQRPLQTWLVLMRDPFRTTREMGLPRSRRCSSLRAAACIAAFAHGPLAFIVLTAMLSPYDLLTTADFVSLSRLLRRYLRRADCQRALRRSEPCARRVYDAALLAAIHARRHEPGSWIRLPAPSLVKDHAWRLRASAARFSASPSAGKRLKHSGVALERQRSDASKRRIASTSASL